MLAFVVSTHAADLSGTWELALSQDEAKAVTDAAVEGVAAEVSWAVRLIVRCALTPKAWVCGVYEVVLTPETMQVQCVPGDAAEVPFEGEVEVEAADGELARGSAERTSDGVTLKFAAENGGRQTSWRLVAGQLELTVSLSSPRLPKPMVWTLPYRRGTP
jgi:hypothetical protein